MRRYRYELCDACGRPVSATCPTYWSAPDALWDEIEGGHGGIRCIPCFTLECQQAGVHISWHPQVRLRALPCNEREEVRPSVDRTRRER